MRVWYRIPIMRSHKITGEFMYFYPPWQSFEVIEPYEITLKVIDSTVAEED